MLATTNFLMRNLDPPLASLVCESRLSLQPRECV